MHEPLVLRIQGFAQEQRDDPFSIEESWIPFFAGSDYPLRLISLTTRFDLREPKDRMQQRLVALSRRAEVLAPFQHILRVWDDDEERAALLTQLPQPVQETVARMAAPAVARDGLDLWNQIDEEDSPLVMTEEVPPAAVLIAAYMEHLTPQAQTLIAAALQDGDVHDPEVWDAALERLSRPLWRRRWLQEYRAMYQRLDTQIALRSLRHYMVAWLDQSVRPDDYASTVSRAFGTGAFPDELPPILRGRYVERCGLKNDDGSYLEPEEPYHPHIAVLTNSGPLKGQWDTTVLHRILGLDLDIALCIDVQPVSRTRMEFDADQKITAREAQRRRGSDGPRDARAERELESAYQLQHDLNTEAPHDVRIVIAVCGDSLDDLAANVRAVKQAGGTRLPLMRVPGQQGALAAFFGSTPTKQIDAMTRPHRMLSHGVAVTVPFGLRRPDRTDGIIWLFSGATPIMFDPFRDKRAAHMTVLGKTGSGKTYALQTWALRLLQEGVQVVVYEPQGHFRRLISSCGVGGARYILNTNQGLNVLDSIASRGEAGEPPSLSQQIQYVISQLSVLLGRTEMTARGEEVFSAKVWTDEEKGALEMALQYLYEPWADSLDTLAPSETPILSDLCTMLRKIAPTFTGDFEPYGAAARKVAALIDMRLIMTRAGATFNTLTTVDWNFGSDAIAYDFSQIPDGALRIFYYAKAFGELHRAIRDPQRDRSRPLVAIIDEFRYMAAVPSLARFAADATKTWRTFGAALVSADQDAHTYLGTENSSPDEAMFSVWLNSTAKVFFRQDAADAERIQQKVQGMMPFHAQQITRLPRGNCVMVWESDDPTQIHNEVHMGEVVGIDAEHRTFSNT